MAAPTGRTPILGLPFPTPDDDVEVPRDVQALAMAIDAGATFIVGEVRFIAVATAPARWLACDGAALGRSAFPALFSAIGVSFGAGDGSTTFNVPDLRGRVPAGAGAGGGLTARPIGTRWGVEAVALSMAQTPEHNHYGATPDHLHGVGSLYTGNHSHSPGSIYTGSANRDRGGTAGGSSEGVAYTNHQHGMAGGVVDYAGNIGIGGQTGASDRSLAFWTNNRNLVSGSANHDNTQPSLAIPAFIYAGV